MNSFVFSRSSLTLIENGGYAASGQNGDKPVRDFVHFAGYGKHAVAPNSGDGHSRAAGFEKKSMQGMTKAALLFSFHLAKQNNNWDMITRDLPQNTRRSVGLGNEFDTAVETLNRSHQAKNNNNHNEAMMDQLSAVSNQVLGVLQGLQTQPDNSNSFDELQKQLSFYQQQKDLFATRDSLDDGDSAWLEECKSKVSELRRKLISL